MKFTERTLAIALLTPSVIAIAIFVYGFIGWTFYTSMTDAAISSPQGEFIGFENYDSLFTGLRNQRFRTDIVNTVYFTTLFIAVCLGVGLLLAILLDQKVKGEGFFRTIYLFPMALSFIVTAVVWRWLFHPTYGINVLPTFVGLEPVTFQWFISSETWFEFNWQNLGNYISVGIIVADIVFGYFIWRWYRTRERKVGFWGGFLLFLYALMLLFTLHRFFSPEFWFDFDWQEIVDYIPIGMLIADIVLGYFIWRWYRTSEPNSGFFIATLLLLNTWMLLQGPQQATALSRPEAQGFNLALFALVVAAGWQMSGYVMAMYLAGLRGISEDLREAARVDGASEWGVYRYVVLPMLQPITLSAMIILGHISLKIFDLVYGMGGGDNPYIDMPGVNMYFTAFRGGALGRGAAIAIILLIMVAFVIVPYLRSQLKSETEL